MLHSKTHAFENENSAASSSGLASNKIKLKNYKPHIQVEISEYREIPVAANYAASGDRNNLAVCENSSFRPAKLSGNTMKLSDLVSHPSFVKDLPAYNLEGMDTNSLIFIGMVELLSDNKPARIFKQDEFPCEQFCYNLGSGYPSSHPAPNVKFEFVFDKNLNLLEILQAEFSEKFYQNFPSEINLKSLIFNFSQFYTMLA